MSGVPSQFYHTSLDQMSASEPSTISITLGGKTYTAPISVKVKTGTTHVIGNHDGTNIQVVDRDRKKFWTDLSFTPDGSGCISTAGMTQAKTRPQRDHPGPVTEEMVTSAYKHHVELAIEKWNKGLQATAAEMVSKGQNFLDSLSQEDRTELARRMEMYKGNINTASQELCSFVQHRVAK